MVTRLCRSAQPNILEESTSGDVQFFSLPSSGRCSAHHDLSAIMLDQALPLANWPIKSKMSREQSFF
jgi:hypothetical protein